MINSVEFVVGERPLRDLSQFCEGTLEGCSILGAILAQPASHDFSHVARMQSPPDKAGDGAGHLAISLARAMNGKPCDDLFRVVLQFFRDQLSRCCRSATFATGGLSLAFLPSFR